MFYEQRMEAPESPEALRSEYDADLAAIVDQRGIDDVTSATNVGRDDLEALIDEKSPELALEEAAEIQSLPDGEPDPETIVEMACEHLLLGMTTAVLDVDAVASNLAIDLDAKEVQQKIERRAPMTFDEFVAIQYAIAVGSR